MKRYPKYKDSGVEWLGKIPEHWEIGKIGTAFDERLERVNDTDYPPLSVTMQGIVPQLDSAAKTNHNDNRKRVNIGDFVINSRSDRRGSSGLSELEGSVSVINIVLKPRKIFYGRYLHYLLKSYYFIEEFYRVGRGIVDDLWTTKYSVMKNIGFVFFSFEEQKQIARFLDRKLEQINHFISNKQRLIELLKEQKTAIINGAVTKGLNPHAPMKPSDIEWLEEIPEHWGVKRAKYYFYEVDERSESGTEELLSVSHITGVTPRSEKNITMFQAESYEGYKTCQVGDLVSNIMWAWMGALGVSNYSGIVSSSYGVYRQKNHDNFVSRYLDYLVRTNSYISEFICRSKGIRSSRLRMYTDDFFDIPIIKPPKEDQEKILNYIDAERVKINLAIAKIEKEIELIQEYRTTLISDAVTGKIDIRDTSIIETTLTTTAN